MTNTREEMGKLRNQSKLAIAKLDELKAAGEETWETVVAEMDKMASVQRTSTTSVQLK